MTEQLEKTVEQVAQDHMDDLQFDEIYVADLDWMAMNGESGHVTIIQEVGCEYVVGINYDGKPQWNASVTVYDEEQDW